MAKRTWARWSTVTMLGLVLGLPHLAGAAQRSTQALSPTTAAPSARGRVKFVLKNHAHGTFAIVARRLAASTAYDVVVDGTKVGSLATRTNGAGEARFAAPKRRHAALMGFDPRGAGVAVRDAHGDDVLECDLPDDDGDASAVACCLPEDGHVECEDRRPEKCLAAGGEVSSASGCFPDPCATSSNVVCCIAESAEGAFCDDGPEVRCEEKLSADACAAAHGIVVEATSCESNPCAPVPPSNLVVCCVPEDGDEAECEIRTPERCAAHGGTVITAKSCAEHPCGRSGGDDDDQGESQDGDHGGDGNHGGGDG